MDLITLAAAKGYTQQVVSSMATGIDHFEVDGTELTIFCSNGEILHMSFSPFKDGATITDMKVVDGKLVIELDNGDSTFDAGELPTSPGKIYRHEQEIASESWSINHCLNNQYPVVMCFDEEDNQICGEVDYQTDNLLVVTFDIPLKGYAIIKNGG